METVLAGIPRVLVYLDDILVTGASHEEHVSNLKEVLSRLQQAGLRLRKDKCEFMVSSVKYLGHIIDANGLHPAPDKLKAVKNAPAPQNVTELKAYLGLLTYYSKFLNQARAWFLRIASVHKCLYACVFVCVCVSAPKAINN